jgi:hypothetical protein
MILNVWKPSLPRSLFAGILMETPHKVKETCTEARRNKINYY